MNGTSRHPSRGWTTSTVEALAGEEGLFTDGDWVLAEDLKSGHDVRLLQLGDIGVGKFLDRSSKWISSAKAEELGVTPVLPGDILISRMAEPIARACLVPDLGYPCITAVDVAILRVDANVVDPRFALLVFNSDGFRNRAVARAAGVTRKRVSRKNLAALEVALPPLAEQRLIVGEFEAHLSGIRSGEIALGRAREALRVFRESLLTAAVSGRLVSNDSTADTGDVLRTRILDARAARYAAARLGRYRDPAKPIPGDIELPKNWTWTTVDELAIGVQYGTSAKTSAGLDGVPVLRMGNVVEGRLDLADLKYLPGDHPEFPRLLLDEGDLLFNRTNSPELVGKTAVARRLPLVCSFASYLIRVRLADEVVPDFVSYFINSPYGRSWVRDNVSQQVGQANVNGSKLRTLTIPLPPRDVQERIVDEVEHLLSTAQQLQESLSRSLRDASDVERSLLHTAVAGQLLAPGPSSERRAQLLARVQATESQRPGDPRRKRRPVSPEE